MCISFISSDGCDFPRIIEIALCSWILSITFSGWAWYSQDTTSPSSHPKAMTSWNYSRSDCTFWKYLIISIIKSFLSYLISKYTKPDSFVHIVNIYIHFLNYIVLSRNSEINIQFIQQTKREFVFFKLWCFKLFRTVISGSLWYMKINIYVN